MSVDVLRLVDRRSTKRVLLRELNRVESETGVRCDDWLKQIYDEAVDLYLSDDGFDWDSFDMHMSCEADCFIDFWKEHFQHLNNEL